MANQQPADRIGKFDSDRLRKEEKMLLSTDAASVAKYLQVDPVSDVTIYKDNTFLQFLKMGAISLVGRRVPIRTAPPPGWSASDTYSLAMSNNTTTSGGGSYRNYTYTHKNLYGRTNLSGDQVIGTKSDSIAYISLVKGEKEALIAHGCKQLEKFLFGDGFGIFGRIGTGTTVSSTTIQLSQQADAVNFERGQILMAVPDVDTSASRTASTNGSRISSVDYNTSGNIATITLTAAANDATNGISTAVAVNDYLYVRGNHDEASSPVKQVLDGLSSHLPGLSTAHDTFFGVTRTGNSRLRGLYLDGTDMTWVEILLTADANCKINGGTIDLVFVSPTQLKNIQLELLGRLDYSEVSLGKTAGVSFKAIEFVGQSGQMVRIVASRGCSDTDAFFLDSSTWMFCTLDGDKEPVSTFNIDGTDWLRTTGDAIEMRAHSRSQLVGTAQGHNLRCKLKDAA